MIQMTLIQIDNYGPWTVTPSPKAESDLQILQAELYADLEQQFAARGGLVFFTRFDNMLAISNNISIEDHKHIQKSIGNRYPITISMGIGAGNTPYDAQYNATKALQKYGSAQSPKRKEILAVDSIAENGFVQIAHIDINGITKKLTDTVSAYDTFLFVNKVYQILMDELFKKGALIFFIGGDNFMSLCNGVKTNALLKILKIVDEELNIELKAGVGKASTAYKAANLADLALEAIREGNTSSLVHMIEEKEMIN